jgi:hypothetical protein
MVSLQTESATIGRIAGNAMEQLTSYLYNCWLFCLKPSFDKADRLRRPYCTQSPLQLQILYCDVHAVGLTGQQRKNAFLGNG